MQSLKSRLLYFVVKRQLAKLRALNLPLPEFRKAREAAAEKLFKLPANVKLEETRSAGCHAEWLRPDNAATDGVVLYLHGGAYVGGSCITHRALAGRVAAAAGRASLIIDYRLAPEHPFPAAVDDCLAVYRALLAGPTGRPRVITGDSAGGNLALVTLMQARDAHLSLPACAVLLSPAIDISMSGPSIRYNAKADPMFSAAAGDLLPDIYCPGLERTLPLISPLHGDWRGLPPLYFLAGSTEMLLDDSVRAHDRAQQAGTSSRIDVWPDMPHVFPLFPLAPEAKQAIRDIVAFIDQHARDVAALPQAAVPDAGQDPALATGLTAAEPANRGSL